MSLLITILGLLAIIFGLVILVGAPYLPTLKKQTDSALKLLDLKPGQTLVELGSGDGRVLKAAAKQGIKVIGYELNPVLVIITYFNCWRYRSNVTVKWGSYWKQALPECDGIYVFLLEKYMTKLDNKIIQEIQKPVKLVSYAFSIPGRKPKHEKDGLFLYQYNHDR